MILTWPICLARSAGYYSFKKFLLQWACNYLFIYEQLKFTWHTGWFKKAPYFLFDLSFYSDKNFWKSWNFWKFFFTKPQQSHRNWSFTNLIEIETFSVVCLVQSIVCSLCIFLTRLFKFWWLVQPCHLVYAWVPVLRCPSKLARPGYCCHRSFLSGIPRESSRVCWDQGSRLAKRS